VAITCSPAIKPERFSHHITGDEVLSVNGTAFKGFTHQQALDTFKVYFMQYLLTGKF